MYVLSKFSIYLINFILHTYLLLLLVSEEHSSYFNFQCIYLSSITKSLNDLHSNSILHPYLYLSLYLKFPYFFNNLIYVCSREEEEQY